MKMLARIEKASLSYEESLHRNTRIITLGKLSSETLVKKATTTVLERKRRWLASVLCMPLPIAVHFGAQDQFEKRRLNESSLHLFLGYNLAFCSSGSVGIVPMYSMICVFALRGSRARGLVQKMRDERERHGNG